MTRNWREVIGLLRLRSGQVPTGQYTLNKFGARRRQGSVWRGGWLGIFVLLSAGRGEGGGHHVTPGIGAEGVDVCVLGEMDGLIQSLAEIGEGGGGFGFDLTLGDGGEDAGQGGAEIAGGEITAGEERGYVAADVLGGEGLRFPLGMEAAEARVASEPRSAAATAIGEGEGTQAGTVVFMCGRKAVNGAIGGHGSLQKKRI